MFEAILAACDPAALLFDSLAENIGAVSWLPAIISVENIFERRMYGCADPCPRRTRDLFGILIDTNLLSAFAANETLPDPEWTTNPGLSLLVAVGTIPWTPSFAH